MEISGQTINYQTIIEDNFLIKNKQGKVVPFIFWDIQDRYYVDMRNYYGLGLAGVRDIILKARKEGFSALILGIFAVDFIWSTDPISSVSISDTKDETQKLLKRAKFYIESFAAKNNRQLVDICDTSNKNELVNKLNGATFWIGTAGSKVALRTETVQNLHFSEGAHFPDTDIITAKETYEGAQQMVDQGIGKIFDESTARGYGNEYQTRWSKAYDKKIGPFRPIFFAASDFYSKEWLVQKRQEFTTDEMFMQEYPETPEEAFVSSGSKFFDTKGITHLTKKIVRKPLQEGSLNYRGEFLQNTT